jgi:nicotinate-nucleotide adenylyltransferase
MKIALYLGSFNPFHNGHLEVIKTALNDFKMDKVIIVPTMQNPWKEEKVLDIDKRIKIIKQSLLISKKDNSIPGLYQFYYPKGIGISSIEKELIPPYYSYATLHALKNKYCNDEIFVLCGEDTIKDIPNWMHGGKIIEDYNFLIVDRPRNSISSTQIREMLRTRHKMDAYYSDEKLGKYVCQNVIELLKKYY